MAEVTVIGGVRFYNSTIYETSITKDSQGKTIYNVTLNGGTKISYPEQEKGKVNFNLDSEQRVTYDKNPEGCKLPLIKQCDTGYSSKISIYGLRDAVITGDKNTKEEISLLFSENNTMLLNDGDKHMDTVIFLDNSKKNSAYLDKTDYLYNDRSKINYNKTQFGNNNIWQ